MRNITVKIDDETYRKARILAAEREISVSAMVREFLEGLEKATPEEDETARYAERRKKLQKLWDMADARDKDKPGKAGPFNRGEIYEERLR